MRDVVMRSGFLKIVEKARRPWGIPTKIAVGAFGCWLVLDARLAVWPRLPPGELESVAWFILPWVSILSAIAALAQKTANKFVVVSLLLVWIPLGLPFIFFSLLVFIPDMLVSWFPRLGSVSGAIDGRTLAIFFELLVVLAASGCLMLLSHKSGGSKQAQR